MSSSSARAAALKFVADEQQFHLGFLPTEQSNPLTKDLDKKFAAATVDGIRCLQRADREVLKMAQNVLASSGYQDLTGSMADALRSGHRIVFSGCGATGRLSILLESMWRKACAGDSRLSGYADQVFSIMTGGDYALVKSVEFFEDYQEFGRRQTAELELTGGDVLVAITEGGETSSVLGTLFEALDRGVRCFLLFNNPAKLLAERLERSRRAIEDPRVTVLDLFCGPMAIAGSTRMQATTSEQLIAGSALETAALRLLELPELDYAAAFERLLDDLENSAPELAAYADFEAGIYRAGGLMTYFASDYLLDVFTDTTERTPTFMLPPFKRSDEPEGPAPWAMAKDPLAATDKVWKKQFHRPLRCLEWTRDDYLAMGAAEELLQQLPRIAAKDMLKFTVGSELDIERCSTGRDAAVLVGFADAEERAELVAGFGGQTAGFAAVRRLVFGGDASDDAFVLPASPPPSPLCTMRHLAVKLAFNTISTGVMVMLGRVSGNWMSFVAISNKKLIDRAIRLIAELGQVDYRTAAILLFEAQDKRERHPEGASGSLVQTVLRQLKTTAAP